MELKVEHLENFGIFVSDAKEVVAECIYEIIYTFKRRSPSCDQLSTFTFDMSKREFNAKYKLDGKKVVGAPQYTLCETNCKLLNVELKRDCHSIEKTLMKAIVKVASAHNCKEICGAVKTIEDSDRPNLDFYLNMGFKIEKRGNEKCAVLNFSKYKSTPIK